MKATLSRALLVALLGTVVAVAGEPLAKPYQGSDGLERMKSLVGTWPGTIDRGQGPVEVTLIKGGQRLEKPATFTFKRTKA